MSSYNKCILMGNLVRDPELKNLPNGDECLEFTLGLNRNWYDASGTKKEEVSFVDCVAYKGTAAVIAKFHQKGDPIHVEGRLKQEKWKDKETGKDRSKLRVIVSSVAFIGNRHAVQSQEPAAGTGAAPDRGQAPPPGRAAAAQEPDDDDVPF